ncbi:MAG TPA: zf-HC2 domain-containing protein [Pyrinomonadaceae bacterium]|nr:zf-HC2 domain-containing protein [Pyrinomonadaceae bacterium]
MFTNHVASLSSAYFHGELSTTESHRVAEHLLSCPRCRAESDEVKAGARFAEQLQISAAPRAIWPNIVEGLDDFHEPRFWFLKPLAIAASIILILTAALVLLHPNKTAGEWNVARLDGAPRIDFQTVSGDGKIAVGQWLETDATSRAKIDVAAIGSVEVDPNSRVRLLEANSDEHRLELARGRLSAHISAPPRLFFVDTPSGVAEDLGCAYTLEVNDEGDSILHVTLGWVALQLIDRESSVPAGAACAMKKGYGPGTPYFEDATQAFKMALSKFDFGNEDERAAALATILREARPRDAMTLWYLLIHVKPADRAGVYDRMTALVPAPQDVTRDGVLNLDPHMLSSWKTKLSIRSDLPPKKVHSFWAKLWTETVGRIHGLAGKR